MIYNNHNNASCSSCSNHMPTFTRSLPITSYVICKVFSPLVAKPPDHHIISLRQPLFLSRRNLIKNHLKSSKQLAKPSSQVQEPTITRSIKRILCFILPFPTFLTVNCVIKPKPRHRLKEMSSTVVSSSRL